MRQFQVPQFIMVEDRIIGPLTVKQALTLGIGVLLVIAVNFLFSRLLAIFLSLPIIGLALSLTFIKINRQSFSVVLKNALIYWMKPRVFLWKRAKAEKKQQTPEGEKTATPIATIPKLSDSKLSDLAWSLDIKEKDRKDS